MKLTAAAAIGALILAASAVPAVACGYWDGGIVQSGPPGGPPPDYAGRDCPCYCPGRQDYGDRRDHRGDDRQGWRDRRDWSASDREFGEGREFGDGRGWIDERGYDSGWRDDGADYDGGDDYGPADYSDGGDYDVGPGYVDERRSGGFVESGPFVNVVDFDLHGRSRFQDRDRHPLPPPHRGSWESAPPRYATLPHGYRRPTAMRRTSDRR
ncbi:MAG: hypothetical protein WDM85_17550 [Caulobacteraceae bacterium]